MKKNFLILLASLIILIAIPLLARADGMTLPRDWSPDKRDLIDESNQTVFINYEEGLEKMIVSIGLDRKNKDAVWIFPVPASSEDVVIDVLEKMPELRGADIKERAKEKILEITDLFKTSQIYPQIIESFFTRNTYQPAPFSGLENFRDSASYGAADPTTAALEPDIIVQEHLEKSGMTIELITAKKTEALYDYLKEKGLKVEKGSIPVLDKYIGKDYSFVISWINSEKIIEEIKKEKTGPISVPGQIGKALNFDGTNHYVNCGTNESLNIAKNLTIEAWINLKSTDNNWERTIVGKDESFQKGFVLRVGAAKVNLAIGNTTSWPEVLGNTTFSLNKWHYVVGTFDGNYLKVYLDGKLDGQKTITTTITPSSGPLWIGGTSEYARWFDGKIDEVAYYNKALTIEEIQQHYQNGLEGKGYCDTNKLGTCPSSMVSYWNFDDGTAKDIMGNNNGTLEEFTVAIPELESEKEQRGVFITFPTPKNKIYFPLYPTSVYESTKIPIEIRVLGSVKPTIYQKIKSYTETSYWQQNSFFIPEELKDFYGNIKTEKVPYTKIEIKNAPAKYLVDDLWMKKGTPFKIILASATTNIPKVPLFFLLIILSYVSGLVAGKLVFRKKAWIYGLLGLANIFTIIGVIIGTAIIRIKNPKISEEILEELKKAGANLSKWDKRKPLFVILFTIIFVILTYGIEALFKWYF
ncbi:MAG: hypothetical protein PHG83_00535 [Patescibacteria group bacterium]|nr:hypothetical protein [Patescibacteria group bacterium]